MITITPEAAAQIRKASETTEADDMGAQDQIYTSGGIDVLISESCKDLLRGATLDYVEIDPGQHQFIFINPNDPRHQAPPEGAS